MLSIAKNLSPFASRHMTKATSAINRMLLLSMHIDHT